MEAKEYLESGLLELYVFGVLSETENEEITTIANKNPEIKAEIESIEKAIIALSSNFSPFISHSQFEKTKARLELKYGKVIPLTPKNNRMLYLGWVASVALLLGLLFQFNVYQATKNKLITSETKKSDLEKTVATLEEKNKNVENALTVVRDTKNTVVPLAGQTIDPKAYAKVYWNKDERVVYVDAAGLPEPPEGMVYQVWALKLNPLTPTSIGLLENFTADNEKIFKVENNEGAEAFGITLEPVGGSKSPTLEKLYALGKV